MSLIEAARTVRENAYAPYSGFKVGAALRAAGGRVHVGCNVENVAYPEGTCAEAGAIAAMVAAGDTQIAEVAVIADSPAPVPPCGGCRQKIAEFARPDVPVTLATTDGETLVLTVAELLPGAFGAAHMELAPDVDARAVIAEHRRRPRPGRRGAPGSPRGLANGEVTDAQAGAFAMAVWLRGVSAEAARRADAGRCATAATCCTGTCRAR